MERYDFAKVWSDSNGVRLLCTDPTEMELLVSQLKQFFPRLQLYDIQKIPSGEVYFYHIKKLDSKDANVLWWIIKHLCSHGWEPLGAASYVHQSYTDLHYQFRRKVTT